MFWEINLINDLLLNYLSPLESDFIKSKLISALILLMVTVFSSILQGLDDYVILYYSYKNPTTH